MNQGEQEVTLKERYLALWDHFKRTQYNHILVPEIMIAITPNRHILTTVTDRKVICKLGCRGSHRLDGVNCVKAPITIFTFVNKKHTYMVASHKCRVIPAQGTVISYYEIKEKDLHIVSCTSKESDKISDEETVAYAIAKHFDF